MKKRISIVLAAALIGINVFSINAFATNTNNRSNQESQKKERPEKPKNQVFGKITAISENSVTISLAEMKKQEKKQDGFDKNFDGQGENGRQNWNKENNDQKQPPERKELSEEQKAEMKKKMEEMFTLTGETKTIDISKADFNAFGRGPKDGKAKGNDTNANNDTNNNVNNNQRPEKTYKDYQVGDYISIELESETSNKATAVREAFGMRNGMPRGDKGQGKGGIKN